MRNTLLLIASCVVLVSCATRERIVYIKAKPYQFQRLDGLPKLSFRTHPEDAPLLSEFISLAKNKLDFCNSQITDYENSFEPKNEAK